MGTEELYAPDRPVAEASPVLTGGPEAGAAFAVEPGSYPAGRHGARIADVVVRTTDGAQRLNTTPTELTLL